MQGLIANAKIVQAVPPQSAGGAIAGDYVSMKNYRHLTILVACKAGATGGTCNVKVKQAKDVAGTSVKDVESRDDAAPNGWYAAGNTDAAASDAMTDTTVASDQFAIGTASKETIHAIEVPVAALDVDNDFDCVRVDLSAAITNGVVSATYILSEPRYGGDVASLPSAIVD